MVKNAKSKPATKAAGGKGKTTSAAPKAETKARRLHTVTFYAKWCKSCGLCSAFCVKKIIQTDETGLPFIAKEDMESCTGCRFCEIHCPDFAITIQDRHPERRRSNGK